MDLAGDVNALAGGKLLAAVGLEGFLGGDHGVGKVKRVK
jgi:hypothetical protein